MRKLYKTTKQQSGTQTRFSQPLHAFVNNRTFVLLQVVRSNWIRRNKTPGISRR